MYIYIKIALSPKCAAGKGGDSVAPLRSKEAKDAAAGLAARVALALCLDLGDGAHGLDRAFDAAHGVGQVAAVLGTGAVLRRGAFVLVSLALLGLQALHAANALKNLISGVLTGIAVVVYVAAGAVQWTEALKSVRVQAVAA